MISFEHGPSMHYTRGSESYGGWEVKKFFIVGMMLLLSLLCACSGASKREIVTDDKAPPPTVARQEYEELLVKYKALQEKYATLEKSSSPVDRPMEGGGMNVARALSAVEKTPDLVETVDVFASRSGGVEAKSRYPMSSSSANTPLHMGSGVGAGNVNQDSQSIRESIALLEQKKYSEAIEKLAPLRSSTTGQIRVRAKFYTGEAFFQQGEYDLSMQAFEDILAKESFSGIVLKTLGRLVTCSEKLKIKEKQETYYSMLHDFFEN